MRQGEESGGYKEGIQGVGTCSFGKGLVWDCGWKRVCGLTNCVSEREELGVSPTPGWAEEVYKRKVAVSDKECWRECWRYRNLLVMTPCMERGHV